MGVPHCVPPKMTPVGPLGGTSPPKNMHFGGVFRVIFKNYLLPQFCSDSETACGFANFRAISKSSNSGLLNFVLVSDLWDFEVGTWGYIGWHLTGILQRLAPLILGRYG